MQSPTHKTETPAASYSRRRYTKDAAEIKRFRVECHGSECLFV